MEQAEGGRKMDAIMAKKHLDASFKRRGIIIGTLSGMSYGMYTAFMTFAMSLGVWSIWYDPTRTTLSEFGVMFVLSALGAAITDGCSALFALGLTTWKGKLADFFRSYKSKPGLIMAGAAIIGGPLASTCYVIGLQLAGSIIVPISALCPAIGAILGRILFKQKLNARIVIGILICFSASVLIGSTGLSDDAPQNLFLGLFFGLLAAIGWGVEGCVCGYSSSLVDSEIGITIRQTTSAVSNLLILVPIFSFIAGVSPLGMIATAVTDGYSMLWFIVAGFCAYFAFGLWYKGNSMCGAALGMSCNGTFSFWGPFFCWIIIGLLFGQNGWTLAPIAWLAAIIMIVGIFVIAVNPLSLFKKEAR